MRNPRKALYHILREIARGARDFGALALGINAILSAWAVAAFAADAYVPEWMAVSVGVTAAALGAAALWALVWAVGRAVEALRPARRLGVIDSYTICQAMARRAR